MNISPITNQESFKGIDCRNLCKSDSILIKNEIKKLEEMGKVYDIKLVSSFSGTPNFSRIEITVRPLEENLKNIRKMFSPQGNSSFKTGFLFRKNEPEYTILDSVREAIRDLNAKLH